MTLLNKVKAVGGVFVEGQDDYFLERGDILLNEQQLQALIDQEIAQYQAAIVAKDKALENAKQPSLVKVGTVVKCYRKINEKEFKHDIAFDKGVAVPFGADVYADPIKIRTDMTRDDA